MSYTNRPHSEALRQSLKDHGMDTKRPSQLSDAFRVGWWAAENHAKQQRAELLEALKELTAACTEHKLSKYDGVVADALSAITKAEEAE